MSRVALVLTAWLLLCGFPLWNGGQGVSGSGTQVATIPITETSGSASLPSGSYVNFEACFADGVVPSGSKLDIRDSSGVSVPTQQYDGVATYASGALRCASAKIKTPSSVSAGATANYQEWSVTGSPNNSSSLTTSTITGSHDFKLDYLLSGTHWIASLNTCLSGSNFRVISQGPVGKEWRCNQPFLNGATPHSAMWARFYVRLFEDNSTIRVVAEAINSYVQNGGDISVTSAVWEDGASAIVSLGAYTHYYNGIQFFGDAAQDGDAYWTANKPAFMAMPLQADMQTANEIFEMGDGNAGLISAIGTTTPDTYSAMYNGVIDGGGQDGTGFHNWLGQMMLEPASALISRQKTWYRQALVRDLTSMSYSAHWYESANFNLAVLNNQTYSGMGGDEHLTSWGVASTLTLSGGNPLFSYDGSHYPSWGKTYLFTGDAWSLDEMQAHAVSLIGAENPGSSTDCTYRNDVCNSVRYWGRITIFDQQARGAGWALRVLDDAEWVTPDNDPAKQYFKDLVSANYSALFDYQQDQYATAGRSTLGWVYWTDGGNTGFQAGWEHDFLAETVAQGILRGRVSTSNGFITSHIQLWTIGSRLTGTGCPYYGFSYRLMSGVNGASPPPYASGWNQVNADDGSLTFTQPMFPGGVCPSSGMWATFPYTDGPEAYPPIGQAAMEALTQAGVSNASTVRDYIINNRNGNVSYAGWATAPQFMIRPRGF